MIIQRTNLSPAEAALAHRRVHYFLCKVPRATFAIVTVFACASVLAENAVVGTGTPASCTETTFNAALALVVNDNQGGTLSFNCGPDPDIILFTAAKNLINFVAIDGGGKMTLDGQNQTRLFNVNQDGPEGRTDVTLRNIHLTHGNAGAEPFGGAVLVNANTRLTLDQVTISNSLASVAGGAIATFAGVTLNINNSRFLSNLAANGGAIATRAVVSVTGSSFTNNNASGGEGGAIQSYEQNLIIQSSHFGGNGAKNGGAIFKSSGELGFSGSSFTGNSSTENGGALNGGADVTAVSGNTSQFRGNSAGLDGGGIFLATLSAFQDLTMSGNSARAGGAIRLNGGDLTIDRASLYNNTARLEGGAISAFVISAQAQRNPFMDRVTTSGNRTTAGNGGDFAFTSSVVDMRARLRNLTLMGAMASAGGSTLHISGTMGVEIEQTLLWPGAGLACVSQIIGAIESLGGNIGSPLCGMLAPSDATSTTFAGFGLGEFANYGSALDTFLPLPGSPAIDRSLRSCSFDARGKPAPVDGDGNGSALCDAGAVERQLREPPPALFRNGFESE